MIVLVIIIHPVRIYSDNIIDRISHDEILKLKKSILENCKQPQFFQNLKKNKSYPKFGSTSNWNAFCTGLEKNKDNVKEYFSHNLRILSNKKPPDLLTGYYEPTIKVSHNSSNIYRFPILKQNKFYYKKTREEIEKSFMRSDVIVWARNKVDLFFLQIQGSGIGVLENGDKIKIAYSGNNGLKYTSIGKYLIKQKKIKASDVSMFTIKDWLNNNPEQASAVMNKNKRFIFFDLKNKYRSENPIGSFGTYLKPNFSIAVDNKIYPIGIPFLIEYLDENKFEPVISLDTGGAIKGINRADLFKGNGKKAERIAGELKKKIYLLPLIPYSK